MVKRISKDEVNQTLATASAVVDNINYIVEILDEACSRLSEECIPLEKAFARQCLMGIKLNPISPGVYRTITIDGPRYNMTNLFEIAHLDSECVIQTANKREKSVKQCIQAALDAGSVNTDGVEFKNALRAAHYYFKTQDIAGRSSASWKRIRDEITTVSKRAEIASHPIKWLFILKSGKYDALEALAQLNESRLARIEHHTNQIIKQLCSPETRPVGALKAYRDNPQMYEECIEAAAHIKLSWNSRPFTSNVIGNLRETVLRCNCRSVCDCTFEENEFNCLVQGICNGSLSAIVVNAGENVPGTWRPLSEEHRRHHGMRQTERDSTKAQRGGPVGLAFCKQKLKPMLSELLQIVLLEAALIAEKPMVGRVIHVSVVAHRCQLDTANIVRNLRHEIVLRHGISIDGGVARQTRMDRTMHGVFYSLLPIVVVDLDAVVAKKELSLFPNERCELSLNTFCQRIFARELSLSISQNHVAKGCLLDEDLEAHQIALTHTQINLSVLFMSTNHRGEVKRTLDQPGIGKRLTISIDARGDVDRLVVKHKSNQIIVGARTDITGLINEDRKLPHEAIPHLIKMPRDTPRRRDSPPCVERCFIYTTRPFDNSIIAKREHMFSIIETNMCSTYRKAA